MVLPEKKFFLGEYVVYNYQKNLVFGRTSNNGQQLRQHLLNKTTKWQDILDCIKCEENELVHEKVLLFNKALIYKLFI